MASPDHITLSAIGKAIQIVQNELIWKPGSAERHLRRRINRGHLPITATLYDLGVTQLVGATGDL